MTDRGQDWYKRDPIRFLDGVQGLGPELIGAYSVLIDLMYARAGSSRRDDHHLGGILGCSTRKAKALTDALIERGKIVVDGAYLTNNHAQNTARSRRDISEVRASAGRTGGIKSGQSRKNKALSEANASSKHEPEKRREESTLDTSVSKGAIRAETTDLRDKIWSQGLSFLMTENVPEKQARSLIGKWLKANPPEAVDAAFRQAHAAKTRDPVPYIETFLKTNGGASNGRTRFDTSRDTDGLDELQAALDEERLRRSG